MPWSEFSPVSSPMTAKTLVAGAGVFIAIAVWAGWATALACLVLAIVGDSFALMWSRGELHVKTACISWTIGGLIFAVGVRSGMDPAFHAIVSSFMVLATYQTGRKLAEFRARSAEPRHPLG